MEVVLFDNNNNKEKTDEFINVYNWTYVIPSEVITDFEKTYHVKVNYDNYSSNEELLAKIQSPSHNYDLIFPSDYMVQIMIKQDLLAPLNYSNIPNSENISDDFKGLFFDPKDKYSIPFEWSTAGISVNTNKVQNYNKSWDILFDEKFKNDVTVLDDMRYGILPAIFKLGYNPNTKEEDEINKAKELMFKQKEFVKAYSSDTYIDMLKKEEVAIAYGWSIDLLKIQKEKPHIRYFIPKEGSTKIIELMCIPKESKRKGLAEKFINYILIPEIHAKISNYSMATNPNEKAKPFINENYRSISDSVDMDKLFFLKDVGDATIFYDNAWNDIKNK